MTQTYTDVFGLDTVPPASYDYAAYTLTADSVFVWPYNAVGPYIVAKIMEVTTTPGSDLILPHADEVSVGEDFLVRNMGSNTFTVLDSGGNTLATVDPGVAKYFYLTDNTTEEGNWAVLGFGAGSSTVDAGSLIGYGIKAIGTSLNQSHPVITTAVPVSIMDTYRAQTVNYTGGTSTLPLAPVVSVGDDFFFLLRNSGTGTLTIDPNAGELIDGGSFVDLQPGESAMLVCSGSAWFTVGLGRSLTYNFTQLVFDVSAGGPFTLTATQASNKLLKFIGSPAGTVVVNVPPVVAVYYVYNNLSTANSINIKTPAGSGALIQQGQRVIVICDGINVVSAQSASSTTSILLVDGSPANPAMAFASQTNTGIYKSGVGMGVTVAGTSIAVFGPTGLAVPVGGISGGIF